jgi:methionine synthase I (cobalamin-dependent)
VSVATSTKLRDLVTERGVVICDGPMGTMLQAAGIEAGEAGERWNLDRPDEIAAIHRAYAEAGCDIVTTNTFGGTSARLAMHGLDDRVAEINSAAASIARSVAEEFGGLVAGNLGPSGELIEPLGVLSIDDARTMFAEQAAALAEGGAEMFLIETMSDLSEVEAAILACADVAPELEVVATMSFDTNGRTMMGVTAASAVARMAELGATGGGANCGRSLAEMRTVAEELAANRPESFMLVTQPNAGLPHLAGECFVYDVTPEDMVAHLRGLRELGIEFIGGCCGNTPQHMAAVVRALRRSAA